MRWAVRSLLLFGAIASGGYAFGHDSNDPISAAICGGLVALYIDAIKEDS